MEFTEDHLREIIQQEVAAAVRQELTNMFRIANEKEMQKAPFVKVCNSATIENFLKQIDGSVTSVNYNGFIYSREAISLCMNMDDVRITKNIYPMLAKIFKTSNTYIERAIRVYIERLWKNGSFQQVAQQLGFGLLNTRPTNTQFIVTIANYLKTFYPSVTLA